ncbi:MAG: MMPL family transporter [Deltaproteobacteria bacterium]
MKNYFQKIDLYSVKFTEVLLRNKALTIILSISFALICGYGAQNLKFSTNYRVFFSESNPELKAFESFQSTYTKNDNVLFVVKKKDSGSIFNSDDLSAIKELTEQAWQIPYVIRVDSVTNFQHTSAIADDLVVEDLINEIDAEETYYQNRLKIALEEPLLLNQSISKDGKVSAVNAVLQFAEKDLMEVPQAVNFALDIERKIEADYPNLEVYVSGVAALNNAFAEAGMKDAGTITPIMFLVIFALVWLIIRAWSPTVAVLILIILSTMVGMGIGGYAGIELTPISMAAPTVILTLAVADAIHIYITLKSLMQEGIAKQKAIVESLKINFLPVTITSATTIVGFLALNFSDSPPYWHLGNITAVGIGAAWLFSITLLPVIISLLPYSTKVVSEKEKTQSVMLKLANFVIDNHKKVLAGTSAITLIIICFIPTIKFDDQWVEYFDESVKFRSDSDVVLENFGVYPIEYSIPAKSEGGISEPEYLQNVEKFIAYLREIENVEHVYSISDIMKRLNKNMHGDDQNYYKIPEERDLSAQYLLLYELSLPYGLDLNDRINIDKSASRVTVTFGRLTTAELKNFLVQTDDWMKENFPNYMQTKPTGASVMFTYITERNISSMITGTMIAIFAIALMMIIALRSFKLGLLSLIPNGLPILTTFGAWAILVGDVGFSVATVASISLGIVVDDTVHFLSKYVRAREDRQLSVEDSIRYAFDNVGMAIVINTFILAVGFGVLTSSTFKLNVDMGLMTILAIVFALILDFLLLPAILLFKNDFAVSNSKNVNTISPATSGA